MTARRVYLDHNATTPLLPEVRAAMLEAMDVTGNASSIHAEGRKARSLVEAARRQVASLVGAEAKQVVFTGSATEAITQAIVGGARTLGFKRIALSEGEHQAVYSAAEFAGLEVVSIGITSEGLIDLEAVKALASEEIPTLFALHWVNGETGVVQPVDRLSALVGPTPHYLFLDGVQGAGKLDLTFGASAIDMIALSAHKIGGPQGVGALVMKSYCDQVRLIPGGGQETGRRGGTENVAGIAGFGAASVHFAKRLTEGDRDAPLVRILEDALAKRVPDIEFFGQSAPRTELTSYFAIPGMTSAVTLMGLDLAGFAVSNGSACSSGKVKRSRLLQAMGVEPALADGALRVSLGWTTTRDDIETFIEALQTLVARREPTKVA